MLAFCSCEIGDYRRKNFTYGVKLLLSSLSLLYATAALVLAGINFNLMYPLVGYIALSLTGVAITLMVLLRSPLGENVTFSWRSLGNGGWASIALSPLLAAVGWHDFWDGTPGGWRIAYTIAATVVQYGFAFCIMLYLMRVTRSIRANFGRLTESVSIGSMAEQRKFFWHMKLCTSGSSFRRHISKARSAADRRRKNRQSARPYRVAQAIDNTADAYEDTGSWLTITLLSASLFSFAVNHLSPGPLTALIFFIPLVLIPIIHFVRIRFLGAV